MTDMDIKKHLQDQEDAADKRAAYFVWAVGAAMTIILALLIVPNLL